MQRVFRDIANGVQWRLILRAGLNIALVSLLAFALFSVWVPTAFGNLPILKVWEQQLQKPDRRVERLGNVEVIPVVFEGAELFTLASPTVWDRTQPKGLLPVEIRAGQVGANLNRVIEGSFINGKKDGILTNFDPKTFQVSIVSLNDVPVIIASDSYHTQPLKLVTVTYIDADYNGQPVAALAEQWRSIVYQRLYAALMERGPDALSLRGKLGESLLALAVMLAASGVLWLLQTPLRRRNWRLRRQQLALAAEVTPDAEALSEGEITLSRNESLRQLRENFLQVFRQRMTLQQQRSVVGFFRWLLAWGQVAVWLIGLTTAIGLFPWTKQFARYLLGTPTILLLLWFLTSWINRMSSVLLHGLAEAWVKFGASAADDPQRDSLRVFTILSAIRPLKTFVVYAIGVSAALVYLGVPLSLVLTLAGVSGLAVLLVCQNFVRDWLMGCLILWEDQYAMGDVIITQNYSGLVERMNLRLTQLHDLEGRLISIANGSISQVENLTRSWLEDESREALVQANSAPPVVVANTTAFTGAESNEPTVNES